MRFFLVQKLVAESAQLVNEMGEGLAMHPAWRHYKEFMARWTNIYNRLVALGVQPEVWTWDPQKERIVYKIDFSQAPEVATDDAELIAQLREQRVAEGIGDMYRKAKHFAQDVVQKGTDVAGGAARGANVRQLKGVMADLKKLRQDMKRAGYVLDPPESKDLAISFSFRPGDNDWKVIGKHPDFQAGKDIGDAAQRGKATGQQLYDALEAGKLELEKLANDEIAKVEAEVTKSGATDINGQRAAIAKKISPKAKPEAITAWVKNGWLTEPDMANVHPNTLVAIIKAAQEEPKTYSDKAALAKQAFEAAKRPGKPKSPTDVASLSAEQIMDMIARGTVEDIKTFMKAVGKDVADEIFSKARADERKKWGYDKSIWGGERLKRGEMSPDDANLEELQAAWSLWTKGDWSGLKDLKDETYMRERIRERQKGITSSGTFDLDSFYEQLGRALIGGDTVKDWLAKMVTLKRFEPVAAELAKSMVAGHSLSDAMKAHPDVFPAVHVSKVRIMEKDGTLDSQIGTLGGYTPPAPKKLSETESKKFAETIGKALKSGKPLLDVLKQLGTPVSTRLARQIEAGSSFKDACEASRLLPPAFTDAVDAGEKSGELDQELLQYASGTKPETSPGTEGFDPKNPDAVEALVDAEGLSRSTKSRVLVQLVDGWLNPRLKRGETPTEAEVKEQIKRILAKLS